MPQVDMRDRRDHTGERREAVGVPGRARLDLLGGILAHPERVRPVAPVRISVDYQGPGDVSRPAAGP